MENFMSNENNEEIELFDYMDEESESRKIPVNKKEKAGGGTLRLLFYSSVSGCAK